MRTQKVTAETVIDEAVTIMEARLQHMLEIVTESLMDRADEAMRERHYEVAENLSVASLAPLELSHTLANYDTNG